METDLSIRLQLYATATERLADGGSPLCARAIACRRSSCASASAAIISSHTRILRGDAEPAPAQPGQDELDILIAGKSGKAVETETGQADRTDDKQRRHLPLLPGTNTLENLALGAEGILVIKGRNG